MAGNGRRISAVVSAVDLAPTILDLVSLPAPKGIDGRSIAEHLFEDPRNGEAFSIHKKNQLFSIRTPGHHLIRDSAKDRYHFFDLVNDPGETDDLWPSKSAEATRLADRLAKWITEYELALASQTSDKATPIDPETEAELRALGYLVE
jgi:arylsulfatase A-like enzyme